MYGVIKGTYLATLVRFTDIVDVTLGVVVFFARDDCIHTSSLAFEGGRSRDIASAALDL